MSQGQAANSNITDNAQFLTGASKVTMVGFLVDEITPISASEGGVGAARMTPGHQQIMVVQPYTSGGLSSFSALNVSGAVISSSVKSATGQVYSMEAFNTSSSARFVRMYDMTGAPTAGSTGQIIWRGLIPGNAVGAGVIGKWETGKYCGTGIGIRVSGNVLDDDATVLGPTGEIAINLSFK